MCVQLKMPWDKLQDFCEAFAQLPLLSLPCQHHPGKGALVSGWEKVNSWQQGNNLSHWSSLQPSESIQTKGKTHAYKHTQKGVNILTPSMLQSLGMANVINEHKKHRKRHLQRRKDLHIKPRKIYSERQESENKVFFHEGQIFYLNV